MLNFSIRHGIKGGLTLSLATGTDWRNAENRITIDELPFVIIERAVREAVPDYDGHYGVTVMTGPTWRKAFRSLEACLPTLADGSYFLALPLGPTHDSDLRQAYELHPEATSRGAVEMVEGVLRYTRAWCADDANVLVLGI